VAADRQDTRDTQPSRLADLLEGFESYIGERSAWSDRAMKVWRREFREFGIEGKTADDLIAVAHEQLLRAAYDPSAAYAELRPGHFWCPSCEEEQYPDEVGIVTCEACGATIETYATEEEVPSHERT
jgi:hypothetical protein